MKSYQTKQCYKGVPKTMKTRMCNRTNIQLSMSSDSPNKKSNRATKDNQTVNKFEH